MAEVELLDQVGEVAETPIEAPAAEESIVEPEAEGVPEPVSEDQHVEQPQLSEEEVLEGWIQRVSENSRTLAEIPAAQRARVVDELRTRDYQTYESSAAQIYQQALKIGRTQVLAEIWVQGKDALLDDDSPTYDPGAFGAWRKQAPEEYRAYMAFKAQQPAAIGDQSLDSRLDAVWADLRQYPQAAAAVTGQLQRSPLNKDPHGVAQLEKLAQRAIGRLEAAGGNAAQQQVEQRAQNAERLAQLPRPPAAAGVASRQKPDVKEALSHGYEAGVKAFRDKHGFDPP